MQIWIIEIMDENCFLSLNGEPIAGAKSRSNKIACYCDKTEAIKDIENNVNDISEGGTNPYVVLYPLEEGIPFAFCEDMTQEIWFHFDREMQKYVLLPGERLNRTGIIFS